MENLGAGTTIRLGYYRHPGQAAREEREKIFERELSKQRIESRRILNAGMVISMISDSTR